LRIVALFPAYVLIISSICLANEPEKESITFDVSKKSYAYHKGESPVAEGNLLLDLSAQHTESSGRLYDHYGEHLIQTTIQFSAQKFVVSNLAAGLFLSYSRISRGDFSAETGSAGPCFSFFSGKGKKDGYPFTEFGLLFTAASGGSGSFGYSIVADIGYAHFISRNVAVTFAYGFNHTVLEPGRASVGGTIVGAQVGLASFIY